MPRNKSPASKALRTSVERKIQLSVDDTLDADPVDVLALFLESDLIPGLLRGGPLSAVTWRDRIPLESATVELKLNVHRLLSDVLFIVDGSIVLRRNRIEIPMRAAEGSTLSGASGLVRIEGVPRADGELDTRLTILADVPVASMGAIVSRVVKLSTKKVAKLTERVLGVAYARLRDSLGDLIGSEALARRMAAPERRGDYEKVNKRVFGR